MTNFFFVTLFFSLKLKTLAARKVGFIGLGNMGAHMARNLIKNGHKLVVHDVSQSSMKELEAAGATSAKTPMQVAESCDRIVTMLPSSPHVLDVYTGPQGIFKNTLPGTICMDSSTIDPQVSKEMAEQAASLKAVYLDSPVSGGFLVARHVTFMVGGDKRSFESMKPVLECMGASVVHTGLAGTGQAAKICNNMLLAICMIGTAETMNLGQRLGLDAALLASIINSSSGRSWSSDTYNPVPGVLEGVPSSRGYQGGFATKLMTKLEQYFKGKFLMFEVEDLARCVICNEEFSLLDHNKKRLMESHANLCAKTVKTPMARRNAKK